MAIKGKKEPNASPNFLPTVSSYPGVGAKDSLILSVTPPTDSRIDFSVSSSNIEATPVAAVSTNPAAPGIIPLKNSPV